MFVLHGCAYKSVLRSKDSMKKLIIVLLTIFYASASFALDSVDLEPGLSLEECLTIALTNHPSLRKSKGATRAAVALLEQTKAANRVKINLTGRTTFAGDYDYWDNRSTTQTVGLSLTKTLYDTGVNRLNREIRAENIKSVQESERQAQITVAADAKRAYYDLVLKILNRDVEQEKLRNLEEHLRTAKGIYDVGNSSYIEVTKAEADLSRVSLLTAENNILTSQESLKAAMGVSDFDIVNLTLATELFLPARAGELENLLEIAMADRSDYRKMAYTLKQDELSIKVAARGNAATITGSLGTDYTKREGQSATTDYNAAINVNIPVADGGLTKAQTEAARAQLEQDLAEEERLRQTITKELRSSALSLTNAIDRVRSSEATVKYAEENLTLAQGRYEVGVGNMLEVSDAVSSLASSRYAFYQALYDAQIARTNLDEAMGHLPPEIDFNGSVE